MRHGYGEIKPKTQKLLTFTYPLGTTQDDLLNTFMYYIRLKEGYHFSGYGSRTKHCSTLADCLHHLETAEVGEPW